MKLSPLLAQYLYTRKYLALAGIGRFTIEEITGVPDEPGKVNKGIPHVKIKFENNQATKDDEDLVSFIATQSGKMKSLAAADLDSHMELAKQFLNIGKPFTLEGIGTLAKKKTGEFEFTQGHQLNEKNREEDHSEVQITSSTEESFTDYQEMFSPKKKTAPAGKKVLIWFIVLASIGLAVWGGYYVYSKSKKSTQISNTNTAEQTKEAAKTETVTLDTFIKKTPDSAANQTFIPPGNYKFVVETSARERALKRFGDLTSWGIDVRMETKDSVTFKLYFLLPATPADTARIRDSLGLLYSTISKAYVE